MKKLATTFLLLIICQTGFTQETIIKYLSGIDKDHTVNWDFFCTGGRKSGSWTKIPVPSNWEMQGFGAYNYGHDKDKASEKGIYKHEFTAGAWADKNVFIVFEGAMTDTKVVLNGHQVGTVHQGGFYQFKYDITPFLKATGKNLLEVTVDKNSANATVNNAERKGDFWVFGGIYRPVFLEIVPKNFVERVAINAKADGSFQADVYAQNLRNGDLIEVQLQTLNGQNFGKPFTVKAAVTADFYTVKGSAVKPKLWSAEFPNLYQALISIKNKGKTAHQFKQRFGFRTVELRLKDGFYVNGQRVILKGSNRHSFWPESGRTLSKNIQLMDVRLMKEMNMNAVRMSHYPPDRDFLDVCDSLGLYVIDELTGWQNKYDNEIGRKLVKELVVRDVNHPTIVFWANGNEGGFNRDLDNDYALFDPQDRTVIHPWEKFNGTDTKHYPDYNYIVNAVAKGEDVFFPTEFMHGLYDGGAAAALDDFWSQMLLHPHIGGGFIWAFLDESIIRADKAGIYDGDGNHAPDGIVGPHREKEASFYTIKEIWSPVFIDLPAIDATFKGEIPVENRYSFTDFNQCTFKWKLVQFPDAASPGTANILKAAGTVKAFTLGPGKKGVLDLALPAGWARNDALYLTAYGPDQKEVFTWSWAVKQPKIPVKIPAGDASLSKIVAHEEGNSLNIDCDGIHYYFDKTTGYIEKVIKGDKTISLSKGPVLAGVTTTLKKLNYKLVNDAYGVEADYQGAGTLHVKWTFISGQLPQMSYQYQQTGEVDFLGITFAYPEAQLSGMTYLGRGPYRVWKNRLKGQLLGVWHKAYNNSITGESWGYPEFKGYHAEVSWVKVESKESPFTVYIGDENVYLQMLKPARESAALKNNNVEPAFPEGSIGFLNKISPIGTKFQAASVMGPQSQKNHADGTLTSGTLFFKF
jgi:hypothetical protein